MYNCVYKKSPSSWKSRRACWIGYCHGKIVNLPSICRSWPPIQSFQYRPVILWRIKPKHKTWSHAQGTRDWCIQECESKFSIHLHIQCLLNLMTWSMITRILYLYNFVSVSTLGAYLCYFITLKIKKIQCINIKTENVYHDLYLLLI